MGTDPGTERAWAWVIVTLGFLGVGGAYWFSRQPPEFRARYAPFFIIAVGVFLLIPVLRRMLQGPNPVNLVFLGFYLFVIGLAVYALTRRGG